MISVKGTCIVRAPKVATRSHAFVWLVVLAAGTGCATTSVSRMDVSETKDVSGHWNDTDSRLTAEEEVRDCLARPWLAAATSAHGHAPTVVVASIVNRTHEHLNTQTFVEDLQRELLNSGLVRFVASKSERADIREEKADQDVNASEETRKEFGQEHGADFVLNGAINDIVDREGGEELLFFQVVLKLTDIKTNEIVWQGQKKIKKFVKRADVGW
jgi:uncharacterized protein (TIGR02722 family)